MYKKLNLDTFVLCAAYRMSNEVFYLSGFFVQSLPVWQLETIPDIVFASPSTLNLICAGCSNCRTLQ